MSIDDGDGAAPPLIRCGYLHIEEQPAYGRMREDSDNSRKLLTTLRHDDLAKASADLQRCLAGKPICPTVASHYFSMIASGAGDWKAPTD